MVNKYVVFLGILNFITITAMQEKSPISRSISSKPDCSIRAYWQKQGDAVVTARKLIIKNERYVVYEATSLSPDGIINRLANPKDIFDQFVGFALLQQSKPAQSLPKT